jgi:hypothetical protein
VTVRVRLFYQAMTASHVAALAAANTTDDRGTKLTQLWQQTGGAAPFVIAEVTRTVNVVMPSTSDAGDAGLDGSPKGGGGSAGGCGCATTPGRANGFLSFVTITLAGAATRRRARRRR